MHTYLVEYQHEDINPLDSEFFRCQADNEEHAKEQTLDAYPGAVIIAVTQED